MLSARDVEEALKERLLRGAYPRGGALPSVRALAAELGTSPSTVGRAVQELARQGWVTATSRRGAVVRRDLPTGETGVRDAEAAIRRLAVRWRLVGGDRVEFQELVARVADEVFQPAPRTVFLECNPVDLQRGLDQVQRETSVTVEPMLLEDAADGSGELKDANVLLTPYFHLAEARELAPEGAQVVPLNFVASQDAMRALVELPAQTLVGVLAVDARSRRRLEAIVQQYSAATVLGALLDDPEAAASLVERGRRGPDHQRRQPARPPGRAGQAPGPGRLGPGAGRPRRLAGERGVVFRSRLADGPGRGGGGRGRAQRAGLRVLPGQGRAGRGRAGGGRQPRRLHPHRRAARRPGRAWRSAPTSTAASAAAGSRATWSWRSRFGLRFHLRDQVTLAPCDDGTALAFDSSLDRTVEHLRPVVGDADADAYRRFAGWAGAGVALLARPRTARRRPCASWPPWPRPPSAPRRAGSCRRCSGRPPTWSARWSPTSASRPPWPTGRPTPSSPRPTPAPAPGP